MNSKFGSQSTRVSVSNKLAYPAAAGSTFSSITPDARYDRARTELKGQFAATCFREMPTHEPLTPAWQGLLGDALRQLRRLDALLIRLRIPAESFSGRALTAIKAEWLKCIVRQVPAQITPFVNRWFQETHLSGETISTLAGLDACGLDHITCDSLQASVADLASDYATASPSYDLYAREAEFLLLIAGFIPARPESWFSTIVGGAESVWRIAMPVVLGYFNAGVGVAAGLLNLSGSISKHPSGELSDKARKALAFYALFNDLYAAELEDLTQRHSIVKGWSKNSRLLADRVEAINRRILSAMQSDQEDVWIRLFSRRQRILFGLLVAIGTVLPRGPCREPSALGTRVDDLLASYPDIADLDILVALEQVNSITSSPKRQQVYLEGSWGTGKTRFVSELGKALQLPVFPIRVNSPQDLGHLLPRNISYEPLDRQWSQDCGTDATICGSILYAILTHGCLNVIIHIDEASAMMSGHLGSSLSNHSITDGLKILFDDTTEFYPAHSVAPGFEFNSSFLTIIVASNRSMSEAKIDPALQSRLRSFHFGKLSKRTRMIAARNRIEEFSCDSIDAILLKEVRNNTLLEVDNIVERSLLLGYEGAREIMNALSATWSINLYQALTGWQSDPTLLARTIELHIPDRKPDRVQHSVTYQKVTYGRSPCLKLS